MQYLKDDVRERILSAALKEFKEKGYLDASMRRIAQNAGIATGSIYRYYINKEDLFHFIIEPVYDKLMKNIKNIENSTTISPNLMGEICEFKNLILQIFKEHSVELLILLEKGKGSKFENIKEGIVLLITKILNEKMVPQLIDKGIEVNDTFITYVLSTILYDGVCTILRNYDDGEKISYLIDQLIYFLFDKL